MDGESGAFILFAIKIVGQEVSLEQEFVIVQLQPMEVAAATETTVKIKTATISPVQVVSP